MAHRAFNPRAPQPTAAPLQHLVDRQLWVRQQPSVCGWATSLPDGISSTRSFALVCDSGEYCAPNDQYQIQGCCPSSENLSACQTQIGTMCLDSTAWASLRGTRGLQTGACTASDSPYCVEVIYSQNGYSSWFCTDTASLTVSGYLGSIPPTSAAVTTSSTSTSVSTKSSSTSSSLSSSSPTASSTQGSGGQNNGSGQSSPLSTGAIVGIAVGGIVLILGVLAFIYFMRRLSKKKQNMDETSTQRWTMSDQHSEPWPNAYDVKNSEKVGTYVSPVSSPGLGSPRSL